VRWQKMASRNKFGTGFLVLLIVLLFFKGIRECFAFAEGLACVPIAIGRAKPNVPFTNGFIIFFLVFVNFVCAVALKFKIFCAVEKN
jgi:hypothetical protein